MSGRTAPPSGTAPPATATTPSGRTLDLVALALKACERYDAEFPDERDRYGPAGMLWCRHDNQHVLNWAVLSLGGQVDLEEQLAWLGRILESREFPLDRLARSLEIVGETVNEADPEERELVAQLEAGARFVRSRRSFLTE